ncbi:alpha/beta fold hydrolase [Roseospira goensis]|uniref:Pimeloyl-ACP methyl ester carboxylesterase n=1 Tax=Roseospira goensis TaxID=391922 RepID=A0A7W6WJW4_9PROT|nr:alpha/beta hydrolase [Roseospira goensis]MBB4285480.1 pimeloyl-ACP methyl ester carboxylesterase [Roseospira goensis]
MALLDLGPGAGLYHEYDPPAGNKPTLVFVNALTGNTGAWQAVVAPRCRAAGLGTLCWNVRGQQDSPFTPDTVLDAALIAGDLRRLVDHVAPPRPLPVGLSIGGLYAARAILAGMPAEGLVLLNTLRRIGPRIAWINDAMLAAVRTGGVPLLLDMFLPLLTNEDYQAAHRAQFLTGAPYVPLDPGHGHVRLMEAAGGTDWDLPYEALTLPVLTVTGLQDRLFLDRPIVDELRARLPDARHLTWDDAGHLLPQERPERLADALIAFAAEV